MNDVTIHTGHDTHLQLTDALLMYRSADGSVYATIHDVQIEDENSARKVLGAGVPLTKGALADFATAIGSATAFGGFVPDNLLYTAPNLIAWWIPESVRKTWFAARDPKIGTQAADAAHPAMVFVATPGDWFVFALRKSERPTHDTVLDHSPHFNVWDGGRICTGNVDLPKSADVSAMEAYEHAFFNSRFTHPNRQRAVSHKGGMAALWLSQIRKPDIESMRRALRKSDETLSQAITRISQRNKTSY